MRGRKERGAGEAQSDSQPPHITTPLRQTPSSRQEPTQWVITLDLRFPSQEESGNAGENITVLSGEMPTGSKASMTGPVVSLSQKQVETHTHKIWHGARNTCPGSRKNKTVNFLVNHVSVCRCLPFSWPPMIHCDH